MKIFSFFLKYESIPSRIEVYFFTIRGWTYRSYPRIGFAEGEGAIKKGHIGEIFTIKKRFTNVCEQIGLGGVFNPTYWRLDTGFLISKLTYCQIGDEI